MPADRPYWKGYLKLSLVSCPIALYPAVSAAEKISFRQINKRTGHRLKQQLVDSVTGDVVDPHDKGRGYEIGERRFIPVEDHELEAARSAPRMEPASPVERAEIERPTAPLSRSAPEPDLEPEPTPLLPPRPENTRTIEIEKFVPRAQIDSQYFDKPYFIVPREAVGEEAFAVIRDAMREEGMMALGHVTLASRERPIALEARGLGLRGITLRHLHEIRDEKDYFGDLNEIRLPDEMLGVAKHILRVKTSEFDPAFLTDHYREAVVRMLKDKHATLPQRTGPTPENVVNLMDVLRRSMEAEKKSRAKATPKKAESKQEEARKAPQFKLSISGGKKDAVPKAAVKQSQRRKSA